MGGGGQLELGIYKVTKCPLKHVDILDMHLSKIDRFGPTKHQEHAGPLGYGVAIYT